MTNTEINKTLFSYMKTIILTLLFLSFIAQLAITRGSSMNNTLDNGDFLIVEKIHKTFHLNYKRFDVIIMKSDNPKEPFYVKRIIGLPGEQIKISKGKIYINGTILEEDYGKEIMKEGGMAESKYSIDEDSYFVVGDNRNNSYDSRFFGAVHKNEIIGKAIFDISKFKTL